jgi:uncharacterized protein (DUF1800 family)
MRKPCLLAVALTVCASACASNLRPSTGARNQEADARAAGHVLNRLGYGPRAGDLDRVQAMGIRAYIDEQLHPERIADTASDKRLAGLTSLGVAPRAFATEYYQPMVAARQEFTNTQKLTGGGPKLPYLRWHLMPIAALSLPGDKPITTIQQATVTQEEVRFQRENQAVFDDLQTQKLLRAVYSERQLQEVLVNFWFNHFNVDARKIEDRPVVVEYEREVVRPRVLGRFRDLLGATAHSPAMLFYLDNWLSAGTGRGVNENYGRELMELHTLGVDGGYTQHDVAEVARCFTGWTMKNPHDGAGFFFDMKKHDRGVKHVLGHTIKAGRGIEDGEEVLDILARHPSTARFIATKLVRHFVADDPPPALVDRAARTFRTSNGDLREVVRVIVTSPEFSGAPAYRAKVKSPFEYVASALRATGASITNARSFAGTIANIGEPLYQCQPPTGYGDRANVWINTGTLVSRLNFVQALVTNGANAARVDVPRTEDALARFTTAVLAGDLSTRTQAAMATASTPLATRTAIVLGSPEFQHR